VTYWLCQKFSCRYANFLSPSYVRCINYSSVQTNQSESEGVGNQQHLDVVVDETNHPLLVTDSASGISPIMLAERSSSDHKHLPPIRVYQHKYGLGWRCRHHF
jgi:hypothetical protein